MELRLKSETQASKFWETRTLDDLMFPWTNCPPAECMCSMPCATPRKIFTRKSQSNEVLLLPLFPVDQKFITDDEITKKKTTNYHSKNLVNLKAVKLVFALVVGSALY